MARQFLKCYAHGHSGEWEAICVDLDIAVQGASLPQVRHLLESAISTYLEAVADESPEDQHRLLNRRAPLFVRLRYELMMLRQRLRSNGDNDKTAGFSIPCHA